MPDTVTVTHNWSGTANEYVLLPPMPAARQLLAINLHVRPASNAIVDLWLGLTSGNQASAVAMAAAGRVIDRGNVLIDGKPRMRLASIANTSRAFAFLLHHRLASHGLSLLLGMSGNSDVEYDVVATATLLFQSDLDSMFGIGRIVQTPGVSPAPIGQGAAGEGDPAGPG